MLKMRENERGGEGERKGGKEKQAENDAWSIRSDVALKSGKIKDFLGSIHLRVIL